MHERRELFVDSNGLEGCGGEAVGGEGDGDDSVTLLAGGFLVRGCG